MPASSRYEFVFPQRLVKDVVPRPGGVEVPQPSFAKGAADQWRAWMAEARSMVNELLASPQTDPDIARAADDESSPAWAAMALHMILADPPSRWQGQPAEWIDPAVAAVGPVAAAQVAVWFSSTGVQVKNLTWKDGAWTSDSVYTIFHGGQNYIDVGKGSVRTSRVVGFVKAPRWGDASLYRLRVRLAAVEWAGAVEALEPLSALGEGAHQVMSMLVPQRRDWFGAANSVKNSDMMVSASTLDELMLFSGFRHEWGASIPWPTLLDAVGVDLAEFIEAAVRTDSISAQRGSVPLDLLVEIPTRTAFRVLLNLADGHREAAAAASEHALRWPGAAAPVLAASAATNARSRAILATLLLADLAVHRGDLTAHEWSTVEAHARVVDGPVADVSAVPDLLAALPWARRPAVPVLRLKTPSGAEAHWLPGEREEWLAWPKDRRPLTENELADLLCSATELKYTHGWKKGLVFAQAPLVATAPIIDQIPGADYVGDLGRVILARQEAPTLAAEIALGWATDSSMPLRWAVRPFVSQAIVMKMAEWSSSKKKDVRDDARAYLRRHAGPAARFLAPVALGKPKKAQQTALSALMMLHDNGHGDAVAEAMLTLGVPAAQAWQSLVDAGPLVVGLPADAPVLPRWLAVQALPQVQLVTDAGALPSGAVENVVIMLAISTLDAPYAGLEVVRESCTPVSLAAFVWGLFEQWQLVGYPASEGWVLDALGVFGDDETARRLAPLVRAWPGESAHQRAVKGLDVLLGIGTDVALAQLDSIAQKVKFKGIKDQARVRIDALAEQRGLTAAQLSDRLVPDLGLDADGTTVLDFGDKTFTVGFDEQLRPTVTDSDGQVCKSVPRATAEPGASEAKRFARLKKDVRDLAGLQLRRLEEAMVTQRGWTVEEFVTYLVDHPLVWHLTRRLVWRCDNGFFRVAEDKTFADADDEAFTPQGTVRLAHPLNLGGQASRWASLLADYEILQPFLQVGRDTYTADQVDAFDQRVVPSGKVLGLERRGWRRGPAMDGGGLWTIDRPLADGRVWELGLDPGFVVGMPLEFEEQTIHPTSLTSLDPILVSEILRDLHTLQD